LAGAGIEEVWVSAGKDFCVFHAADTRSRAELVQQLGKSLTVCSVAMTIVPTMATSQGTTKCLAHLRRHFKSGLLGHGNNQP